MQVGPIFGFIQVQRICRPVVSDDHGVLLLRVHFTHGCVIWNSMTRRTRDDVQDNVLVDNQDRPKASNRRNIWRSGAETEELAAGPSLLLQESLQSQPLLEGWAIARTSFQEIFLCAVRSPGKILSALRADRETRCELFACSSPWLQLANPRSRACRHGRRLCRPSTSLTFSEHPLLEKAFPSSEHQGAAGPRITFNLVRNLHLP